MIKKIKDYFIGVVEEAKKVSWPSRKQLYYNTLSVIGVIAGMTIVFGLIDSGFAKLLEYFLNKI